MESRRSCLLDTCDEPHFGRGYCRRHYHKFKRWGDPLADPRAVPTDVTGNRQCLSCDEWKPLSEFYRNATGKDGITRRCRECLRAKQRRYNVDNKEKIARSGAKYRRRLEEEGVQPPKRRSRKGKPTRWQDRIQSRYGLSVAEYESLLAAQGGVCAICKAEPGAERRLDVDHNWKTGVVRGLLCRSCNTGIGLFRENQESLIAAIQYLASRG